MHYNLIKSMHTVNPSPILPFQHSLDSSHIVYIYTHKLKNAPPQFPPWHTLIEWAMDVSSQHEMKPVAKSS